MLQQVEEQQEEEEARREHLITWGILTVCSRDCVPGLWRQLVFVELSLLYCTICAVGNAEKECSLPTKGRGVDVKYS